MDNKKLQFAESLERARKLAKKQGNLLKSDQVKEMFAANYLDEEQYELIFDYLKKHKIGVDEAIEIDDYLANEEKRYLEEYLEAIAGPHEYLLKEIVKIAKHYVGQGVLLEDLIGEGNVVLAANQTVNEAEAELFRKIMEAMEELVSETARNRDIDARMVEKVNAIADDAKELAEAFGRDVTVLELAEEGKYSVDEIAEAMKMTGNDISHII